MTTYTCEVDWPAIHEACEAAHQARMQCGWDQSPGKIGGADVFGGSYHAAWYEGRGLPGAVSLQLAVERLAGDCWDIVHKGSNSIASAGEPSDRDYRTEWWSVDCGGRPPMRHRTHRGAACRATRFGGSVDTQRVLMCDHVEARVGRVKARVRAAIRAAIECDRALKLFAAAGLCEYNPANRCCGVADSRICLTGIRWMQGSRSESETPPTVDEALALFA